MKKTEMTVQQRALEVSDNMRELHESFKLGKTKREDADTVANINGKNLKALSIIIADQMREDGHLQIISKIEAIEHTK